MKYVAKKRHAEPCALCDDAIIPGDAVTWWCWTNPDRDGPKSRRPMGGICRTHSTCYVIGDREGCMDETVQDFESRDYDRAPDESLAAEAESSLAAARAANPTPETLLAEAVALLRRSATELGGGSHRPSECDGCRLRDDVNKFLGRIK